MGDDLSRGVCVVLVSKSNEIAAYIRMEWMTINITATFLLSSWQYRAAAADPMRCIHTDASRAGKKLLSGCPLLLF